MADLQGFDANAVEPNESFDPLPNGDYLCMIVASEMKPTKSRQGSYLELEFEVLEGPHRGRKLWDRLNLQNPNETTVRIARGTLSAICRAVGVLTPADSYELHDRPLSCKVRVERRPDVDDFTNVIKGYRPRPTAQANSPAPPATGEPPWKRPPAQTPAAASSAPY